MCLGVPGKIVEITGPMATVDFWGVRRLVRLDLVESAALLGTLPEIHLVTVSVDTLQPMQTSLSPVVEGALPQVASLVRSTVERLLARSRGESLT